METIKRDIAMENNIKEWVLNNFRCIKKNLFSLNNLKWLSFTNLNYKNVHVRFYSI